MKKSFLRFLPILLMAAGVIGACAPNREAVQVVEYVNQDILMIAELEQKTLERYASVTGENYTSDEAVAEELETFIIPYYGRFVDRLHRIRPESEELRRIHREYVLGAESILTGFRTKLTGIRSGEPLVVRTADREIEKGQERTMLWRKGLEELYRKYGLQSG